jgi:ankyrin repeat protein
MYLFLMAFFLSISSIFAQTSEIKKEMKTLLSKANSVEEKFGAAIIFPSKFLKSMTTPDPQAVEEAKKAIESLLKEGVDINAKVGDKFVHPVTLAVTGSHSGVFENKEIVEFLLSKGSTPNEPGRESALNFASRFGMIDTVKILLAHGVDISLPDGVGNTPLMEAAEGHSVEIVKLLLEKGADVNAKNTKGETALMKAAVGNRNFETIQILLEKNAEVNAKNAIGETALLWASLYGDLSVLKALLNKGADVTARCEPRGTALMRASQEVNWLEMAIQDERKLISDKKFEKIDSSSSIERMEDRLKHWKKVVNLLKEAGAKE